MVANPQKKQVFNYLVTQRYEKCRSLTKLVMNHVLLSFLGHFGSDFVPPPLDTEGFLFVFFLLFALFNFGVFCRGFCGFLIFFHFFGLIIPHYQPFFKCFPILVLFAYPWNGRNHGFGFLLFHPDPKNAQN